VRTFATSAEAEAAGFRPCKRCAPNAPTHGDPQRDRILRVCRMIEQADEPPTLAALAAAVGLSPSHLHRTFKRIVGVTPKQYAVERRMQRVHDGLARSETVTGAIYDAGFASSSRFYDTAPARLGMTPTAYRDGGRGARIRYAVAQCDLGWALVAATDVGICAIDIADAPMTLVERLQTRFPQAETIDDDPQLTRWMEQVLALLEAPQKGLDLPLDIRGTAFQRRVWNALREIAPGTTTTYGRIAARIGQPRAARAVAQACAANPIAVAIPCHRVVRSDGGLGGYRWGTARKRALLAREGPAASSPGVERRTD
jgi:AraC family transcriptional regulator of adaptative response/methylated-DNA-[protein]-cysteine methyltransferase